jgi:anti-anti-sigma factor
LQIERLGPDTLALSGDLDFASFDPLSAALDDVPGAVRLDLSGLTFMDSTGLGLILQRRKVGPVTLVGTSPHIRRMIELCGVADQDGLTFEGTHPASRPEAAVELRQVDPPGVSAQDADQLADHPAAEGAPL